MNAQQSKKIYFEAKLLEYDEEVMPDVEQYSGNVIFRHAGAVGYADKAYHYRGENMLRAFGDPVKVHINDSVTLFGQYIIYDGNTRTISIVQNVILKDNRASLYTDSLIYDLNDDMGYYLTGGKIVSDSSILTSRWGYYHTNTHMADLYDSVLLLNHAKALTVSCQSSSYNTETEVIYFTSRTHLISSENQIFTDGGWFDTRHNLSTLVGHAELFNKQQNLKGDSLYYDIDYHFGKGWNHAILSDSVNHFVVAGNYIEYKDSAYAYVTDSALAIMIDEGDSLFLHADTLWLLMDTSSQMTYCYAYHHTKFYRQDVQGACDSMVYIAADSTITMFYNPVMWNNETQMLADTIRFTLLDSVNIDVDLIKSAFIASAIFDTSEFNQIKGLNIHGRIIGQELKWVEVVGNAECLYFIQEEDSSLVGINSTLASEMTITLDSNEIESIIFYNAPDGKVYPDSELPTMERRIRGFCWLDFYRPKNRFDIFCNPVERVRLVDKNNE